MVLTRISRHLPLVLPLFIALIMVTPLAFMVGGALEVDGETWGRLLDNRVPGLFWNSLALTAVVTLAAWVLGGTLAFLVERSDMPWRGVLRPLLVAPLIIPCYITGICYVNFFGVRGLGENVTRALGWDWAWPALYGFWGAAAILTIGAYPYVYTIVRASLVRLDPTYGEAARCLGAGRFECLRRVTLPLLLPAFSAGGILTALYVLSDFGVVSLLRFPTFVSTIYYQISGRYDYSVAVSLSMVLVAMTILLFAGQEYLAGRRSFASPKGRRVQGRAVALGALRLPALAFACMVVFLGLVLPLGVLITWLVQSLAVAEDLAIWSTPYKAVWQSGMGSLLVAVVVATLAVLFALPVAWLNVRKAHHPLRRWIGWSSQAGVALPGVLIALGLSLAFRQFAPLWNFSLAAMMLAFLVNFFAQGLQMTHAGWNQVSRTFEESARVLGYSPARAFLRVTAPLMRPALMTAWILVFLSAMRELPAALLLRPANFDPLTVKVWLAASEGFYQQAAAPALMLVILSLPLVFIMTHYQGKTRIPD